ncbi:CAAX farnesyltransferase (FTase) subunit beta [Rhizina undulata]
MADTIIDSSQGIKPNQRFEELRSTATTPKLGKDSQEPSYYPHNPATPYIPPNMHEQMDFVFPPVPELFTNGPPLKDKIVTKTSLDQDDTVSKCVPLLGGLKAAGLPELEREKHIQFLESALEENESLPDYMVALDASRPWIVYWCLMGLAQLGVDVGKYRQRVISTFGPLQNESGGFGGGNQQMSHLASTYAAILSLTIVGPDPETGIHPLSIVDRNAMYRWLHSLHDPVTGAFPVCLNGEADVRGVYCALTIISLLGIPTSDGLLTNTANYLTNCQSYEGGFGASPGGKEAHGGYAFCALAALCLLGGPEEIAKRVDVPALVRWLSARQYAPEGGLSGRTNKLVDGCYSTWIGGCWALVEAALNVQKEIAGKWNGVVGSLWSREGLARYILSCCQAKHGGLRDKPGKGPDFYHSAYILLGLGSAQYYFYYDPPVSTSPPALTDVDEAPPALTAGFSWKWSKDIPRPGGGIETVIKDIPSWPDYEGVKDKVSQRVEVQHPLFNVPFDRVAEAEDWGRGVRGF